MYGEQARFFDDEFDRKHPPLHDRPGLLSTANLDANKNTSTVSLFFPFFLLPFFSTPAKEGKHMLSIFLRLM